MEQDLDLEVLEGMIAESEKNHLAKYPDAQPFYSVRIALLQAEQLQGIRKALEGLTDILDDLTSPIDKTNVRLKIWRST